MRILADMHISPASVKFLRASGHDAIRVSDALNPRTPDAEIVRFARIEKRVILTQDLDFSAIIALSGATEPSVITLRLTSSRVEFVNAVLERTLPVLEAEAESGALITILDSRIRRRYLPITLG